MVDSKDTIIPPGENTAGHSSLSGAACAWNIAFNDLKRRYWMSQNDNVQLKIQNKNLNLKATQYLENIEQLKKENRHLDTLLNSKSESYTKLLVVHNELVEQDSLKHQHNKELSKKIEQVTEEKVLLHCQYSKLVENNHQLRTNNDNMLREKKQMESEIENLKTVPEISISETNATTVFKREDSRQFEELISENKHLKTSIHWLSEELHKMKNEGEQKMQKKIHLSGCLEEGFNSQALKLNFPKVTSNMNLPLYIKMLQNTITVLKEQLRKSTTQIKKLLDCKVTNEGLTSEENQLIDTNYKENNQIVRNDSWEKLQSDKTSLSTRTSKIPFHRPEFKQYEYSDLEVLPPESIEQTNFASYKRPIREHEPKSDLYPSLLQNLQLQQTRTYLTENHVPTISPIYQKNINGIPNGSDTSIDSFSRKIMLYEED